MFLHSFLVDFQFICPSNSGKAHPHGGKMISRSGYKPLQFVHFPVKNTSYTHNWKQERPLPNIL